VPKKSPTIDGRFNPAEWTRFASTPNAVTPTHRSPLVTRCWKPVEGANYNMDTYANWDDAYLYFAFRAPFKFATSIELDCDADGYFHGRDNPRLGVAVPRDEADPNNKPNTLLAPPNVMVWNNVEPVATANVPNWTNEIFNTKEKIKWAWGKDDQGFYVIEVAIPKTEAVDLVPKDGKEMGVRFWITGYLPPTEKNPDPRYAFEMFDSCEYGQFKLVK
jgi:hypothetical protein